MTLPEGTRLAVLIDADNATASVLKELLEEVARLKQVPGDGVIPVGGSELAASFLEQGLIDELHFIMTCTAGQRKDRVRWDREASPAQARFDESIPVGQCRAGLRACAPAQFTRCGRPAHW